MSDPIPLSALDLARAIASGRTDARDATEAFIAEIEAGDPDAHVFYLRTFTRARAEAFLLPSLDRALALRRPQ